MTVTREEIVRSLREASDAFNSGYASGHDVVRRSEHERGVCLVRSLLQRLEEEDAAFENASAADIAVGLEHVTSPASGDAPGSGRATFSADAMETEYAAGRSAGIREGLERAAKVADDAKAEFHGVDGWAAVAVKRIADNIRSLINEVSP